MNLSRFLATTFAAALTSGLATAAHAELQIVATVPDLAAIALEVGGPDVKVTALSLATQDPHFVDARPSLALALSRADLLLIVGLELEAGWLPVLQTGARNGNIQNGARGFLDCSTLINPLDAPTGKVDRSMGDIHPGGNPHYLYDPRQAAPIARGIAMRLATLDPAHAKAYAYRTDTFIQKLEAARRGWERSLAELRGAKVIVYHKSWNYLADWLGLEVVEHIEPKPGIPPNPAHVARVLTRARSEKVGLILEESYYPDATARLIAEKTGARLLTVVAGADLSGGEGYVARIERVVQQLVHAARSS